MEFPLKRNEQVTFQEIYNIFHTMKKQHRIGYTPHNITGQELEYFYGLIILENKTIVRLQKITAHFQQQHGSFLPALRRFDPPASDLEYSDPVPARSGSSDRPTPRGVPLWWSRSGVWRNQHPGPRRPGGHLRAQPEYLL